MDKKSADSSAKATSRRVANLKILSRLLEHELDASDSSKEIRIERELFENMLDSLQTYIEDVDERRPSARERRSGSEKPSVTRLN